MVVAGGELAACTNMINGGGMSKLTWTLSQNQQSRGGRWVCAESDGWRRNEVMVESSAAGPLATQWLINAKWAGGPLVSHSVWGSQAHGAYRRSGWREQLIMRIMYMKIK